MRLFKYNPRTHQRDFERLALYFNRLWLWALPGNRYVQHIPLSRLYRTLSSKRNAPLVKLVANIWFEQQSRGSNYTGMCSRWHPRPQPRLNRTILDALIAVAHANKGAVDEMWRVAGENNKVEVVITTTITLPASIDALKFKQQVVDLLAEQPPLD